MGADIEIDCPNCRQNFLQNVSEITVQGSRSCPVCHEDIRFAGAYIFRILRQLDPPPPLCAPRTRKVRERH